LPPVDGKKRERRKKTRTRNSKGTEPFEKLGKKDGVVGCLRKGLKNDRYRYEL
jgi:hypothetical protein